jgi:hypothetical protein
VREHNVVGEGEDRESQRVEISHVGGFLKSERSQSRAVRSTLGVHRAFPTPRTLSALRSSLSLGPGGQFTTRTDEPRYLCGHGAAADARAGRRRLR